MKSNFEWYEDILIIHHSMSHEHIKIILSFLESVDDKVWGKLDNNQKSPTEEWEKMKLGSYEDPDGFWDGRWINYDDLYKHNLEVSDIMYNHMIKLSYLIRDAYKLNTTIYPELFQLARWPEGYELPRHSDAEHYPELEPYEPSHTPHRDFGILTYLNPVEYEGGELYFPLGEDEDRSVWMEGDGVYKPTIYNGTTVVIPGKTTKYIHGVEKIAKGVRYNITSFWTTDYIYRYSYKMQSDWKYEIFEEYHKAHKWDSNKGKYIPKNKSKINILNNLIEKLNNQIDEKGRFIG